MMTNLDEIPLGTYKDILTYFKEPLTWFFGVVRWIVIGFAIGILFN